MLGDLDPDREYPLEFVVFRITAWRPDAPSEIGAAMSGRDLRGDLSVFVTRASEATPVSDPNREPLDPGRLAGELGVSVRTIRRWRRHGLPLHHAVRGDGSVRLSCFRDAWESFERREPELVARARAFARTDGPEQAALVDVVREARAGGASRAQAHRAAARAAGRAVGTARAAAMRADHSVAGDDGRPVRASLPRATRLAGRADRFGIPVRQVAERLGRSASSVRRLIRADAASRVRMALPPAPSLTVFDRADAAEVILARPGVLDPERLTETVERPVVWLDSLVGRTGADEIMAPDRDCAEALVVARAFLVHRARTAASAWHDVPNAIDLDRAATDLRWAAMLGRRLVRAHLPVLIAPIEQWLGGPLRREPAEVIAAWLDAAVDVATETVAHHDPSSDGRIDRRLAWAMGRRIARDGAEGGRPRPLAGERASARHEPDLDLGLRIRGLDAPGPFERTLEARAAIAHLPEDLRRHLAAHEGLALEPAAGTASPPRTISDLAAEDAVAVATVSRRVREARRRLLAVRRGTAAH